MMPLDAAIQELRLHFPTLAELAIRLPVRKTAASPNVMLAFEQNGMAQLWVHEVNWSLWPLHLQAGLLMHELLHLLLAHPWQRAAAVPWLFDLAADSLVDSLMRKEWRLPRQDVLPETIRRYLPEGQMDIWKWYDAVAHWKLSDWVRKQVTEGFLPRKKHETWLHAGVLAQMRVRRIWEECRAVVGAGVQIDVADWSVATQVLWQVDPTTQVGPDWRRVLQLFARKSGRTALRHTVKRPSKRYGKVPGIKIDRRCRLAVAIDTSGSVTPGELAIFAHELRRLWRAGAQLVVLECDYRIRKEWGYRGQPLAYVHGRGGTDFQPALNWAASHHMDGLVYLTDGMGAVPQRPHRLPVLWLISAEGLAEGTGIWAQLPGRKVKLRT